MTNEQRAHDLAILYIQAQIKQDLVIANTGDDVSAFVLNYDHTYNLILEELTKGL